MPSSFSANFNRGADPLSLEALATTLDTLKEQYGVSRLKLLVGDDNPFSPLLNYSIEGRRLQKQEKIKRAKAVAQLMYEKNVEIYCFVDSIVAQDDDLMHSLSSVVIFGIIGLESMNQKVLTNMRK